MKRTLFLMMTTVLTVTLVMFFVSGCKTLLNSSSDELTDDEAAIHDLVNSDQEMFNVEGVSDDGHQDAEYCNFDVGKASESINTIRFGRHGRPRLESIQVEFPDDTTAVATIVHSFDGEFVVVARDTTDSLVWGNIYRKEMANTVTRKAIFRKRPELMAVNLTADGALVRRGWVLDQVSMIDGFSDGTTLSIEKMVVDLPDTDTEEDIVVTNPLEHYMEKNEIPTLSVRDTVKVYMTLSNSNEWGEIVLLHYGTNHHFHRARKWFNDEGLYPDKVAGDKVYSGYWVVRQRRGVYQAFADGIDWGTIYDDAASYNSVFWGTPYRVRW